MKCPRCPAVNIKSFEHHYHESPQCRPPPPPASVGGKKRVRDGRVAAVLFKNRMHASIGRAMYKANRDMFIKEAHLDHFRTLLINCISSTMDFVDEEREMENDPVAVRASVRTTFKTIPSVHTMISEQQAVFARATPRTLSCNGDDKKGAPSLAPLFPPPLCGVSRPASWSEPSRECGCYGTVRLARDVVISMRLVWDSPWTPSDSACFHGRRRLL